MKNSILLVISIYLFCFAIQDIQAQWNMERNEEYAYAIAVSQDTYSDPEWKEVVDALKLKHSAEVFIYSEDIDETKNEVSRFAPYYMAFVTQRREPDFFFVKNVWEYTRSLDDDPYGDVIWGIITGINAEDALRIVNGPKGFDVKTVLGGTKSCDLQHFPEGIATSELTYGLYYTKDLNEVNAVKHTDGPTDRTEWLVDLINTNEIDIFMTSGHGESYQWQLHYPMPGEEGYFRSDGEGGAVGISHDRTTFEINSINPKIFFGLGNCYIGKISGLRSMALGWMHSAGAYFFTGYVIPEGPDSHQHGGTKAFFVRQAHYTWPQAFFLANQALYFDIVNNTPKANPPDLNGSVLYGDPAMEARVPETGAYEPLLYTEEVIVDKGIFRKTVTVRMTMNIEGCPGYTGKWGNRHPIILLPFKAKNVKIKSHNCYDVVVTDNFVLLYVWNIDEDPLSAGESREVIFTCW